MVGHRLHLPVSTQLELITMQTAMTSEGDAHRASARTNSISRNESSQQPRRWIGQER